MKSINQLEGEVPIVRVATDIYKEFYEYSKRFPKKDQYLLAKRCDDMMLDFLECILAAAGSPQEKKFELLCRASARLELLKVLLRIAREFKMLDNKKYLSLETKIQDVGKQLGGWIKSTSAKAF